MKPFGSSFDRYLLRLAFALGLVFTLATAPATAQVVPPEDISPGARAGLTATTHWGADAADDLDPLIGGMVGGFAVVDLPLQFPIALRPELAYIQKGAVRNLTAGDTTVRSLLRTDYLELSILGTYPLPVQTRFSPFAFAGPHVGYNVRAETEDEGPEQSPRTDVSDQVRPVDVGLTVGGGLDVPVHSYTTTIDVRYEVSLTSFYRGEATVRNQGIIFTAGVVF